ncbi:hypothetical protein V7S43_001505 [Phytophthora oleae]|uniref:M96 mating-specific protein family n=1 Tax=Phytophthora oleae TaxID=2107226 RepID=A0ABD3G3X5_9STRA
MAFLLEEEDDGRVLEAAMSFVDKFELDPPRRESVAPSVVQALPCRLDANASDMTRRAVTNAKKRILRKTGVYSDPNRARTERRKEIVYLRQKMEKLQIDVQNLQNRKNRREDKTQPEKRSIQSTTVLNSTPQIPNLWQLIADKQRQRREDAERENVRLKLIAERQRQVAESLTSFFGKRTNQLINDCNSFTDVSPRHQVVHVVDFCGDIGDFQGLFRHLDAARREVDRVFAANGLEQMVLTPCDVHIREGDDGKYLEAFSNKVLPFRLSDSTEAAWEHFKGVEKHLGNGNIYEKAAKDLDEANTVIEAFTKEMHSNNQRADVKVKQVVRRYIERDHDLVIWVAHVSPAEIRHKMLRGLSYILRGYAKIKRSPVSTPDCEISQLQCCSLISFDVEAEAMYGTEAIHTLTNFLVVNSAMKTQGHQDRIESALVDQALKRERTM